MLKLIFGRAGSGKTNILYGELNRRVREKLPENILLVPEQYSHAAERELVSRCGDTASLYAEVLSFTRLADRVRDELGGSAEVLLDDGGRVLTMHMALTAVSGQLRVYAGASKKPEFLSGLVDTVDELKSCRVSPEALMDAAEWAEGSLADKLSDLALIAGAYDAVSGKRDPRDLLARLADDLPASKWMNSTVFVDGFSDFTAQEAAVLRRFLAAGRDLTVALTAGGPGDDSDIFRPAVRTAGRLVRWAEEYRAPVETLVLERSGDRLEELRAIEGHLYDAALPDTPPPPDRVELYRARSPVEECELAAARVRALVMDEGLRYRDIAVTARGFAGYETTAENIFSRFGVPVYTARKADILDKPVLLLITAALDVLDGGWRYDAVLRYLRTGLAGIGQDEVDILDDYVQRWNIYGGMWTRAADWREHPGGYDREMTEADAARLAEINRLRRLVAAPLQALERAGRAAGTAGEQAAALYDFLEAIRLPETLEEKTARFLETGRETLAAEYAQLWDILVSALEQVAAILGDTPMDQGQFTALIRLVLSQYSVGTIPQTLDRVQMGDLDRTRRRDLKCLIVLGATDDRLPTPGAERGVLTDDEREQLRELGLELSETAEAGLYREMALIYHALAAPSDRLILCWPAAGEDGGEKRKSPVLTRIEAILGRECVPVSALDGSVLLTAEAPAFDLALRAGREPENLLAARCRAYFAGGEGQTRFRDMLARASLGRGSLSPEAGRQLYGDKLFLSASRIDNYGSCHFRYFLQYGLRARPRRRAEFDAPVAGTFMHYILENVSREIMEGGGFHSAGSRRWREITDRYIEDYVSLYLGDMEEKTQRFRYLFRRLRRDVYQVVEDMVEELSRSDFVPLDFELTFGGDGALPPVELRAEDVEMQLVGAVDRVDGLVRGDKLYLRVVDYKTGVKAFKLSDIWYGMGMQMLLYLFTLCREGGGHFGGRDLEPAGVLYAPARDVILSAPPDSPPEEIEKLRRRALTRSGVIVRDPALIEAMEHGPDTRFIPVKFGKDGQPKGDSLLTAEELGRLGRHIDRTLLSIGRELRSGDISARPHYGSIAPACTYCDYRTACHYDPETDGARYLAPMSKADVLAKLEEVESVE